MSRSAALKTSAGQHTVEEFFKRLDLKSPLVKSDRAGRKRSLTADEALAAKLGGGGRGERGKDRRAVDEL